MGKNRQNEVNVVVDTIRKVAQKHKALNPLRVAIDQNYPRVAVNSYWEKVPGISKENWDADLRERVVEYLEKKSLEFERTTLLNVYLVCLPNIQG